MKALIVILILLFLLLICPVGAAVRYSSEGISLKIVAGFLKIRILPKKEKSSGDGKEDQGEKKRSEKKKKKKKKKKSDKSDQKKRKEKNETEGKEQPKEKLGGKIEFFRQLLGVGLDALGCLRRKLILRNLVLYLTVGGKPDDAAGSAILYGRAWAAIGALTPVLENSFRIRNRDLQAYLDYTQEETTVYAEGTIVIRIGDILWIAIFYGLKVLKIFLTRRRNKKKGGSKNGSSD